jgi:hypothetical protein
MTGPAPTRMPSAAVAGSADHLDLLVIAHRVRRAVLNDDTERLHAELTCLHGDLLQHVHDERELVGAQPVRTAKVVRDGERRLLRLLSDVLYSAPAAGDRECTCVVRSAEIELLLRRQAKLEASF